MIDGTTDRIARAIDPAKLGPNGLAELVATLDLLARTESGLSLRDVRTATLVALVARASAAQLDAIAGAERARTLVLDEVFRRMAEQVRPGAADGVVRWRIRSDVDYHRCQTVLWAGTCVTGTALDRSPRVTLTLSMADFLRLATGGVGLARLVVTRRLRVRGDLRFAVRLARCFDIPGREM